MNKKDAVEYKILLGGYVEEWENPTYDEDGEVISGKLIGITCLDNGDSVLVRWKDESGKWHIETIKKL